MYKVIVNPKTNDTYYNLTLVAKGEDHFINIYVSIVDNYVSATISKSEDGFCFKSPCRESSGLQLDTSNDLQETFDLIKKYFIDKGYNPIKY